ncbi:MAG: hypothetical protein WAK78_02135 [Candidatus Acidiferrales bacterium]
MVFKMVFHAEQEFSDRFIAYMLSRSIRIEVDLVDPLFNSIEKRPARALWQGRQAPNGAPQNIAGGAGGDDWCHSLTREFFHE